MSSTRGRLVLWAPVVLYMALIFAGSSISRPPQVATGVSDKSLHLLAYGGLGVTLVRALAGGFGQSVAVSTVVKAVVIATLYGISDEFHQRFVPNREVDALDVVADAIGAALAAGAMYAWGIIRGRNGL